MAAQSRQSDFTTRAALILACAILFLGVFFALAGPSWELALYRLVDDGGCAVVWLLAVCGIGWLVWCNKFRLFLLPWYSGGGTRWGLRNASSAKIANAPSAPTQPSPGVPGEGEKGEGKIIYPSLALATCAAIGIGILSLVILLLGLAGWLNRYSAIAIVAAGAIIAVSVLFHRGRKFDLAEWLRQPAAWNWLWALIAPLAGIVILAAFFPPGILWGDEPNGYDVVEYHLQVPREWLEAEKILPLHHNVFSYFPFNVEMHYLLAMQLRGGPWAGMYLAQLMHAAICALAVLAVHGLAGGGRRGLIAGLLTAATPWTPLLAPVAYNDGGTLLFGILAIGWVLRARSAREFLLAGAMAGFAAGTKLSIVPLLFAGVPIALLLARRATAFASSPSPCTQGEGRGEGEFELEMPFRTENYSPPVPLLQFESEPPPAKLDRPAPVPRRRVFGGCVLYLLAAILLLSPWLIRDWAWTGNPVFPEAMTLLGRAHFTDVQVERWRQAYQPDKEHRSLTGHFSALRDQVLTDWRYGYVLLPLGVAAFLLCFRRRAAICLALLFLFQLLFWIFFTHLQSRFMVIAIPIIALLVSQYDSRNWFTVCVLAVIALSCLSSAMLPAKLRRYLKIDRDQVRLIGRENLQGFALFDTRRLGPDDALDLVGDAGAFWYQIPMTRLHYKTVFDVDTSDPGQSIIQSWLWGMPRRAMIWVDTGELSRLASTYYAIPRPPIPATRSVLPPPHEPK